LLKSRTSGGGRDGGRYRRRRTGGTYNDSRRRGRGRPVRLLRALLLSLLAGQDSLKHIPRLRDVGEIYLRLGFLRGARGSAAVARSALKMTAHTLSLTRLDGARVCFAFCQADSFECIENLFTLDFQLTRQIVDSNLTHPPLFVVLPCAG